MRAGSISRNTFIESTRLESEGWRYHKIHNRNMWRTARQEVAVAQRLRYIASRANPWNQEKTAALVYTHTRAQAKNESREG